MTLEWDYTIESLDSANQAKANVCQRANANPNHRNYNNVRIGNSAAAVGDRCRISVVGRADGYSDYTVIAPVTLSVQQGTQGAPSGWSNPYGSNPTLAVGAGSLPIDTTSAPTGQGALEYRVDSADSGICSVAANGSVTAEVAGALKDCVIQARFAGNTSYEPSSWANIATIGIIEGTLTGISWSAGTTTIDVNATVVLNSVVGALGTDTITYTVVSGSCSFGSGTEEARRTLSFSDNVPCVVKATVERPGYTTWESSNVSIEVTDGTAIAAFQNDGGGYDR